MKTAKSIPNGSPMPYGLHHYETKPASWISNFTLLASQYAEKSTMHGIGHFFTGHPRQKLYWSILVLCGMSMAIVHLRFHVKNFMESPVSTEIQHEARDFAFPDVTFCSQTPTTNRMYNRLNITNRYGQTRDDYLVLGGFYSVEELGFYKTNYTKDTEIHRNIILRQRATYSSHTRSFHPSNEMIFSCSYRGEDCMSSFQLVNDPFYWNCYTFRPNNRIATTTNPEEGLVVVLYTATEDISEFKEKLHMSDVNKQFFSKSNITKFLADHNTGSNFFSRILQNSFEPAGIKMVVHDANTYPYAKDHGFVLNNGEYAKIGLEMYGEHRLNRPGMLCNETHPEMKIRQLLQLNGTEIITHHILQEQDCELANRQDFMEQQCGCRSHLYPYRIDDADKTPLCYNFTEYVQEAQRTTTLTLPEWSEFDSKLEAAMAFLKMGTKMVKNNPGPFNRFREKLDCHDSIIQSKQDPNDTKPCHIGCVSSVYKYYLSSVPWPRDYDIFRLVDETILPAITQPNGSFRDIADEILDIDKQNESNWNSSLALIERNFIRVVLHPMKLKSNVHLEKYTYTILEVLSEVGGILGLYLGMSILTLFEVIDMFIEACVVVQCNRNYKREKHHPVRHKKETVKLKDLEHSAVADAEIFHYLSQV